MGGFNCCRGLLLWLFWASMPILCKWRWIWRPVCPLSIPWDCPMARCENPRSGCGRLCPTPAIHCRSTVSRSTWPRLIYAKRDRPLICPSRWGFWALPGFSALKSSTASGLWENWPWTGPSARCAGPCPCLWLPLKTA